MDRKPQDKQSRSQGTVSRIPNHHRFGDLSEPGSVEISRLRVPDAKVVRQAPGLIHLSVTGRCNAHCKSCINSAFAAPRSATQPAMPGIHETIPARDAAAILNLVETTGTGNTVICLYGGEPLLVADKLLEFIHIIDRSPAANSLRYMLYTNGELLEKTADRHPKLLDAIWLLSVSIDGTTSQQERFRPGTHLERIHRGLEAARRLRSGPALMWSTLREGQTLGDCYAEFSLLYQQQKIDQFFWHWAETSEPFVDLPAFAARYEQDLEQIMGGYVDSLRHGSILPLVHINELIVFMLAGIERGASGCGVELPGNYDLAGGKILPCADLPMEYSIGEVNARGELSFTEGFDLLPLIAYKEDLGCNRCGIHSYCGGRCPVQAQTGGMARLQQYCQLMRLHVGVVAGYLPEITSAMISHGITVQQLYDQSGYYAQFTDVTP